MKQKSCGSISCIHVCLKKLWIFTLQTCHFIKFSAFAVLLPSCQNIMHNVMITSQPKTVCWTVEDCLVAVMSEQWDCIIMCSVATIVKTNISVAVSRVKLEIWGNTCKGFCYWVCGVQRALNGGWWSRYVIHGSKKWNHNLQIHETTACKSIEPQLI
jgi:hypothetical protein